MMPSAISSIISYFSRVRIHRLRFTLFGITIRIPTLNLATKADMNRKKKKKPSNEISLSREKSNKQKQTQRRFLLKQAKKTSKFTFLKISKRIKLNKIPRLRPYVIDFLKIELKRTSPTNILQMGQVKLYRIKIKIIHFYFNY